MSDTKPCPDCGRAMTLLFVNYVCDYCDGKDGSEPTTGHRGWIVWKTSNDPGRKEYVFKTRADAERWRSIRQLEGFDVVRIVTKDPIPWQISRGSIRDLELASRLYEIYPNHKYAEGQYKAHIDPDQSGAV